MKRFLFLLPLLITACANPLNLYTAKEYFRSGASNAAQNKWFNARMAFGRAWTNADLGNADDRVKAVYAYEYGRSSGAICDWTEAERGLKKAFELDTKTRGPIHMSLLELARMYHAKGDLAMSNEYFQKAKPVLDDLQADTRDSIGYADFLKEYSEVLSALGKTSEASALTKREQEIRSVFKDRKSNHDDTPYGKYCNQRSLTLHSPALISVV